MPPWDYHPDLTKERLAAVVQLIARGRSDALDRHEPEIGDDNWTTGCRAYKCATHRLIEAQGTPGFEWLVVTDPGMHFQFRIGEMQMRFKRGDIAAPSGRIARPTRAEQLYLDLNPGRPIDGVVFRIIVHTDEDGTTLGAHFVAFRNEIVETTWPIPFSEVNSMVVALDDARPEGRELPPPVIGDWQDEVGIEERPAGE